MATNFAEKWKAFQSLSFEDKREIVLGTLAQLVDQGDPFDILYDYIKDAPNVEESDLIEIYQVILKSMYEVEIGNQQAAVAKLSDIRDRMVAQKEAEVAEHRENEAEAVSLLDNL